MYYLGHKNYFLALNSAILLFLVFYMSILIARAKRALIPQSQSLPLPWWLNLLYPSWLDRLTFGEIFRAFARALVSAMLSWIVLAVIVFIWLSGS